jgi:hypothetical protein
MTQPIKQSWYCDKVQHDTVYHLGNVCYRYAIEEEGLLLGIPERTQWLGEQDHQLMKNVGWVFGFSELDDARRWASHMAKYIKGSRDLIAAYVVKSDEAIWRQDPACAGETFSDLYPSAVMTNRQPLEVSQVIVRFIEY